jgi:3-phenylpropionate/trans-cinnamate dioxygenase ferredoxin subunit
MSSSSAEEPLGFTISDGYGEKPCEAALEAAFRIAHEAKPPRARQHGRITVCRATDLEPGQRRIVEDAESGISIGVFNIGGKVFAVKNVCPHLGAPLCQGSIHATHGPSDVFAFQPDLAGRVLRCPWHGWEFDIVTGKALYDRNSRVANYACEVNENGDIVVLV